MMMTTIKLNRQNYQNLCNISHWSNNQKELDVIGKFWCSWLKIMSKAMIDETMKNNVVDIVRVSETESREKQCMMTKIMAVQD